jgi:hypothetical protein
MPADARAFLLLAARSDSHPSIPEAEWSPGSQQELHVAAGVAAPLNPRPATARVCLPGPSWHTGIGLAGQPVIGWLVFSVNARTRTGDVSGVYVFAVRETCRAIQY